MVVDINGNGNAAECTECNPPRRFKSKAGLNGHTQFKHGHLPDSRAVTPNGKQSQLYEDLTDRVNQVLDRQDDIFDYLKNGNGQGNGQGNGNGNGQGNGNGNGNGLANGNGNGNGLAMGNGNGNGNGLAMASGNDNGLSGERIGVESPRPPSPPEDEPLYIHKPGWPHDSCGASLEKLQTHCPSCGSEVDWSSLP